MAARRVHLAEGVEEQTPSPIAASTSSSVLLTKNPAARAGAAWSASASSSARASAARPYALLRCGAVERAIASLLSRILWIRDGRWHANLSSTVKFTLQSDVVISLGDSFDRH